MKTTIFVPEKINVGFQNRSDTYTKKLAYVIYFDQKGILRKEASWNSWRNNEINNIIYDNTPISGFVLNKKVGDYDSGWSHRHAYCRVYDPRDFEFEISIENLLYILENTSSIKGKGLEGDFVYGWDGTDLVLIPVDSPDYREIAELNKLRFEKPNFNSKELILGATYKSNDNKDLIYLGRFYEANEDNKESKSYFFYNRNSDYYKITLFKSLSGNILDIIDNKCVEDYADLMDELFKSARYSAREPKNDKYVAYTLDEFLLRFKDYWYQAHFYTENGTKYFVSRYRGYSYYRNDYTYDLYDCEKNRTNNKLLSDVSLNTIYTKYKPMYLITYKSNGELIKEWKLKV
jgi:hypothetical protein